MGGVLVVDKKELTPSGKTVSPKLHACTRSIDYIMYTFYPENSVLKVRWTDKINLIILEIFTLKYLRDKKRKAEAQAKAKSAGEGGAKGAKPKGKKLRFKL